VPAPDDHRLPLVAIAGAARGFPYAHRMLR
jgi:hypothetical protein